ncbi:MAG: hypothetical protein JWQ27_1695 [Ferruginibacter sp.]|nr:hypothetical protein [Ferruginibacter sp.]
MQNNIIYIQADGKEAIAWITEVTHRHHAMYKVEFESGYENIFYTDVETGMWLEEDLGFTLLAKQVGVEIKKTMTNPFHVPKILTWHKQFTDGRLVSFGFFNYLKGNHKMYEIYSSSKKYMYTLADMGNEEWQIMGNSNLSISKIDPLFVQHIIQILPLYSIT